MITNLYNCCRLCWGERSVLSSSKYVFYNVLLFVLYWIKQRNTWEMCKYVHSKPTLWTISDRRWQKSQYYSFWKCALWTTTKQKAFFYTNRWNVLLIDTILDLDMCCVAKYQGKFGKNDEKSWKQLSGVGMGGYDSLYCVSCVSQQHAF